MGKARFLAANMVSAVTPSSSASGQVSRAQKEGSGSAVLTVNGPYSGTSNLDYYIEIDAAGTGEIGSATFKWSDDGGATFDATGVTTSTSPVALNNGLTVQWTQGAGADVVIGDKWKFKAFLPYHGDKTLDRDRDTEWRSGTVVGSLFLTADLGSALTPKALVLMDHNLSSAAQIRVQASTVSNFATLPVNDAIPWASGTILHYIGDPDRTYQYWRVLLLDPANTDGYLRVGNLFLGAYTQLTHTFTLGDIRGKIRMGERRQLLSGRYYGGLNTVLRTFDLSWVRLSKDDRDLLVAVFDALNDVDNRRILPVFFNEDEEDPTAIYLCEWQEANMVADSETDAPERFRVPVRLIELPRTI